MVALCLVPTRAWHVATHALTRVDSLLLDAQPQTIYTRQRVRCYMPRHARHVLLVVQLPCARLQRAPCTGTRCTAQRAQAACALPRNVQGRLPIRVELKALNRDDFYRILTEPRYSLIKQQQVRPRAHVARSCHTAL